MLFRSASQRLLTCSCVVPCTRSFATAHTHCLSSAFRSISVPGSRPCRIGSCAHMLHSALHLAFRLCTIRPAQPRREAPIACEVQKHRVPYDLASLIGVLPHRAHTVVQNLF